MPNLETRVSPYGAYLSGHLIYWVVRSASGQHKENEPFGLKPFLAEKSEPILTQPTSGRGDHASESSLVIKILARVRAR
jgi:hypothetical protein